MMDGERIARAMWAGVAGIGSDADFDNEEHWQRLCTEHERDVFRLAAADVMLRLAANGDRRG